MRRAPEVLGIGVFFVDDNEGVRFEAPWQLSTRHRFTQRRWYEWCQEEVESR